MKQSRKDNSRFVTFDGKLAPHHVYYLPQVRQRERVNFLKDICVRRNASRRAFFFFIVAGVCCRAGKYIGARYNDHNVIGGMLKEIA